MKFYTKHFEIDLLAPIREISSDIKKLFKEIYRNFKNKS